MSYIMLCNIKLAFKFTQLVLYLVTCVFIKKLGINDLVQT